MKFDSKTFNPQAFGKYVERIPQLKKNELIKSGALKGNTEIRNAFSSQTGTAYAILPMYGLLDGEVLNYDGQNDITGGVDFMDNVAQQVSEYFDGVDQDTLLAILEGIFNMTGTENKKFVDQHTYDITSIDDGMTGPATLNSAIHKVGAEIRVLKDINSLKTTTDEKGDVFKNNQTVRICDQIATDYANIFNTRYLGKVPNDKSGRSALANDFTKYCNDLMTIRAIEDFTSDDIVVDIGDTKTSVVATNTIKVVNTMEQLYMKVVIN